MAEQAVDDYRDEGVGGQKFRARGASASVLERVRSGGSATLVIRGEPGVGKTVLLDELETLAHDFRVIRTDGIESELQLDYAALHRIVLPFIDRIPQLPAPQSATPSGQRSV